MNGGSSFSAEIDETIGIFVKIITIMMMAMSGLVLVC